MGSPLHPATVHFPITFAILAGVLDSVWWGLTTPATSRYVNQLGQILKIRLPVALIPYFSYYANLLTLITSWPAVITGLVQLLPLLQRDGLRTKKGQVGMLHAFINYALLIVAMYNWSSRRFEVGFLPTTTNMVLSALAVPSILVGAYFGGQLVYRFGMGVGPGSAAPAKKTQ